jgi:predicted N-acetyltransferase YhbS
MVSDARPSRPEELPEVVRLANRVFSPNDWEMGTGFPLLFCEANAEQLRVIDRAGEIVSHVGICVRDALLLGTPVRMACIGAVCTHPDHRGQGLASRLMADARAHAVAQGADLMLISGGRGLYHRLGYVTVGRFPHTHVPAGDGSAAVEVTEAGREDRPAVRALHAREPVRFRRSRDDWEQLLDAGMLVCQRGTLWVARLGGRPVAYLAAQPPGPEGHRRAGIARVEEYAGDRGAIAEAAPVVARRMGAVAVELVGPDGDAALAAHAAARGWSVTIGSFPGTLGVLRPREFLAALAPWIEERLGARDAARLRIEASEGETRFSVEGESVTLTTTGQLAALLFGGETEEARAVPPREGRVGALLQALFPLPLPVYGYNFI